MRIMNFFFLGLLGASGALFTELVASNLYFIFSGQEIALEYYEKVTFFLLLVILIEETFKFILLQKFYTEKDGGFFPVMLLSGLGFASIESYFAFLNNGSDLSESFLIAAGGAIILHVITYGIIALMIPAANSGIFRSLQTIMMASVFHLIYNYMVISNFGYGMIYAYLASAILIIIIVKIWHLSRASKNGDF